MKKAKLAKARAVAIGMPIAGLILLFQNCAPAPMSSSDQSNSEQNVPMSKVVVHLEHADGTVLSDVELVADDVVTTIDDVPSAVPATSPSVSALKSTSLPVEAAASPSSFSLQLPLGAQKIIVARAKVRDPLTSVVSSVYGNAIVTLNEAVGDVTIQLVTLP